MAMTDATLAILHSDTNNSILLVGSWLNSAALWEMMGGYLGLLIVVSMIPAMIGRVYSSVGCRSRD